MATGLADVDIVDLTKRVRALEKKAGIKSPEDAPIGTHVMYPEPPAPQGLMSGPRAPEDELRIGNEERTPGPVDPPKPHGAPRDPSGVAHSRPEPDTRKGSQSADFGPRRETTTQPSPKPGVTTSDTLEPKERR